MLENMRMVRLMEKVFITMQMGIDMKESSATITEMGKAFCTTTMELAMKDNSKKMILLEKVIYLMQKAIEKNAYFKME
jgi:hypothetical protein